MKAKLNRFLFSELELKPLAIFRIALGFLVILHTVALLPHWTEDYGPQGMMANAVGEFYQVYSFSILDLTRHVISIETWWWINFLFAVLFFIGLGGRVTNFCLFWIVTSVLYRNLMSSNSEQTVFRYALFFSILLPLSREYSVDRWLRNKLGTPQGLLRLYVKGFPLPKTWALRSLQLQIACVYPISTYWKLAADHAWIQGEAMYWVIINSSWSRFPWPKLFLSTFVTKLTTWGSLLVEGTFIFAVWIKQTRLIAVWALIVLHITIAIVLANVTYFSLATAACLTVFFTTADHERAKKRFHR